MAELETHFVFIDTSVFESENFFEGKRIQELFRLAHDGIIEIVLPNLTYNELLSRFKKGLKKAENYLNQNRKEFDGHTRLLRNLEPYKKELALPRIKVKEELEKFKNLLDEFFAYGKVRILNCDDLTCGDVFKRYFNEEAPFQSEKENKKHEFPDAFIIAGVERWCADSGQTCYALSKDKDILEYASPSLICINDIAAFVDQINRAHAKQKQKQYIAAIDRVIKEKHFELLEKMTAELEDSLYDAALNINYHPNYDVEEVEDYDVNDIEIVNYSIIHFNEFEARVDFTVRFNFTVKAEVLDYSFAMYDKEDSRWWGEEKKNIKIEDTMTVTVNTTVIHNGPQGKQSEDITINAIDNGSGIGLGGYF